MPRQYSLPKGATSADVGAGASASAGTESSDEGQDRRAATTMRDVPDVLGATPAPFETLQDVEEAIRKAADERRSKFNGGALVIQARPSREPIAQQYGEETVDFFGVAAPSSIWRLAFSTPPGPIGEPGWQWLPDRLRGEPIKRVRSNSQLLPLDELVPDDGDGGT